MPARKSRSKRVSHKTRSHRSRSKRASHKKGGARSKRSHQGKRTSSKRDSSRSKRSHRSRSKRASRKTRSRSRPSALQKLQKEISKDLKNPPNRSRSPTWVRKFWKTLERNKQKWCTDLDKN